MNLEPLYGFAYKVFGSLGEKLSDRLSGLSELVRKAYLGVSPASYISLMLLVGVVSSVAAFVSTFAAVMVSYGSLTACLILSGLAFAGAWISTLVLFYGYPSLRVRKMGTEIERDMPFIASYMAVMASAGVNPYEIFKSLARGDVIPSVTPIARTIVRDVELLGHDALSAIIRAAQLSPSMRFRSFLDGMVGTVHAGSDLAAYLRAAMEEALRTHRVKLREMAETLGVFSEVFIGIFVAGPIFLTIILAVISIVGGVSGAFMNPVFLLTLTVYVLMPLLGILMLLLAKVLTPGE